jgi:hypothetical protein
MWNNYIKLFFGFMIAGLWANSLKAQIVVDSIISSDSVMLAGDNFSFVNNELNFLEQLTTSPTLAFDALLGLKRPHRDCAYNFIMNDVELKQRTFLTYYGIGHKFVPGYFDIKSLSIGWSSENITVNNTVTGRSQILPVDIYNQTAYTLVCETEADASTHSFFTEKIAKPMLAGRPFVVLANQHYLKRLKQLGFQTFESVIDESYDNIEDHSTRWHQALIQMRWLAGQDPTEIYAQSADTLQHNQQLMQVNWQQKLADQISQLI